MRIRFTKMQGLGNDFVLIDRSRQKVELSARSDSPARRSALWHRL
jgi:diaminopimelate epimerase